MTACAHCGAELPDGALFCGECGRSVMGTARIAAATTVPRPPVAVPDEPPAPEEWAPDEFVVDRSAPVDPEPGLEDVAAAEPPAAPWSPERSGGSWALSDDEPAAEVAAAEEPAAEEPAAEEPRGEDAESGRSDAAGPEATGAVCPHCGFPVGPADRVCPNCGFLVAARAVELPAARIPTSPPAPGHDPDVDDATREADALLAARWKSMALEDIEVTRIVSESLPGERYVLQFSTGESVAVRGSGLVGRNPTPEPGEYVDQLVPLFDAGKSVSKTHLEFGQENGRFWVSDRFSTNGSVVRGPDVDARRCEPGRRYLVSRGTRVDIGEQFFVVS